jgi:hypothetical protein
MKDETGGALKHTKVQLEDGRWRIEFIPLSTGVHKVHRVHRLDDRSVLQLLYKVTVLNYSAQRVVYGYRLYNMQDSVQLVFDAASFRVQDIWPEVKDPNDELVDGLDCKYLTDYLALKFTPESPGGYLINFYDRNTVQHVALSPYKIIVHDNYKEIMRSCGVYDLTRLAVAAAHLPPNYQLRQIQIQVLGNFSSFIKNKVPEMQNFHA